MICYQELLALELELRQLQARRPQGVLRLRRRVLLVERQKLQAKKLIRALREETKEEMWGFVVHTLFRLALLFLI
jgi:hypothetical protein